MIKHWKIRDKDWDWEGGHIKTHKNKIIGFGKIVGGLRLRVRFGKKPVFDEAVGKYITTAFPNHERRGGCFVGEKIDKALPKNWFIYLADSRGKAGAPVGRAYVLICRNRNDDPCIRMRFSQWGPGMDYVLLPDKPAKQKGFGLTAAKE